MKKLEDYLYYEEKDPDLKIYCGDCLEILPLLPKVDLVVTDPPYGILEKSHRELGSSKLAQTKDYGDFSWDVRIDERHLNLILSGSKNAVIFGGNYFSDKLRASRCWLVWDKDNTGNFADCELAWTNFEGSVRKFRYRWNGMLQENMKDKQERFHPTQKPIEVMKWAIDKTEFSDFVLDPFLGSGTTLVAAKELNRNGIGIEINEHYCSIAKKRLRATCKPLFTDVSGAKKSTKENDGQNATLFDVA